MNGKININAVNQLSKGTDIYSEGEAVLSIALVLKGRILIHNRGSKYLVSSGTFLGVNDLFTGGYQSTYTAQDDIVIYVFGVNHRDELETILSINKDYHGFMVASLNKAVLELDRIYQGIMRHGTHLYQFLMNQFKEYQIAVSSPGHKAKLPDRISAIELPQSDIETLRDRIEYYKECAGLPLEVVKAYYSYGNQITLYQLGDQADIVNQQIVAAKERTDQLTEMVECLVDDSETCLFYLIFTSAAKLQKEGAGQGIIDEMDNIIEEINKMEDFYERMIGKKLVVNRKRMEETYHKLLTGTMTKPSDHPAELRYSQEEAKKVALELKDSYHKLLEFSGIDEDKAKSMKEAMQRFVDLKDRLSSDDSARAIRRQLTENHYILYKKIFLKAYQNKNTPRMVDMFLKYGYADERLLSKDQLLTLYYLKEDDTRESGNIYNIKDWLTLIYEGKKDPSKNEFDMDYTEMLNQLRKQGKITEKELPEWSENREKKLDYEIQNMFRYNNKTVNGQISTFVPILHMDILMNHIEKIVVTPSKVQASLQELLSIDYSIFDREIIYSTKDIVKEFVIKRVDPDIILMPTVGNNGAMWQEITGKKRDSAGRFLLPALCESNLTSIMVRIFGRFRWEMCRCIEGTAWNDIKHKSLTSEYSDYLQFYRKNRELSEEKKEKIKLQIQRGRSSREIFVMDYEQWIHYESKAAIKLNKPVREIMATYCPFAKDIREKIKLQPIFEEAMARYHRDKLKKVRDIEARYRALSKDQIEIPKELLDTLEYHKDL